MKPKNENLLYGAALIVALVLGYVAWSYYGHKTDCSKWDNLASRGVCGLNVESQR